MNTRQRYDEINRDHADWILLLSNLLTSFAATVTWFEDEADTAERHRALLKEKLQGIQTTAEMVTVGIFELTPAGNVVQANEAWYRLSGYSRDPADDKALKFMDCVYEEDYEHVMETFKILSQGQPISIEFRWKSQTSGGEPVWVLAAAVPLFAQDGTLKSFHCCNTDITPQRRMVQDAVQRAEALEHAKYNEERFLRFTEIADVGVFMLGPDRQV